MINLQLVEGVNNDVAVSAVISGGHIFVQHPLHPSHPSLAVMMRKMQNSYNAMETPLLPDVELHTICVMLLNGEWFRVQIVQYDVQYDDMHCLVKLLDYGGYVVAHRNDLRQIRSDYLWLPFQATECVLSNIEPIGNLNSLSHTYKHTYPLLLFLYQLINFPKKKR